MNNTDRKQIENLVSPFIGDAINAETLLKVKEAISKPLGYEVDVTSSGNNVTIVTKKGTFTICPQK